jgi:nitroimidazol reductase NimA-like FMN-containing flavoprotein (pyridoxamine 5'-phosphate oxidase superfamily)
MSTDVELEGIEVLSPTECVALLARGCVGRVGFVVEGRPHVLPVNYAADTNGVVVFRTSASSLLMAASRQNVAFEVDGLDEAHRTGWSVCVYGAAREITDATDPIADRLRALGVISWAPGRRERWLAVTPQETTGRRLPVHGDVEGLGGWFPGIPT